MANRLLSFTCTTVHDVAEHVSQSLAYGETQGADWLRGALVFIDLVPHPLKLDTRPVPRVVMRADDADAVRMLGVDRWVKVQTPAMSAQHLLRLKVPWWLLTETNWSEAKPLSNLAIAKRLTETLLLVCSKLRDVVRVKMDQVFDLYKERLVEGFVAGVLEPEPPPLNEAQCIGLMERADAWRDHILSMWFRPPLVDQRMLEMRISPLPMLTEKVLDEECPLSPKRNRKAPKRPPGLDPDRDRSTYVPAVRRYDTEALWDVAWLGDPKCNEEIWLRRGPSPQTVAGSL